MAFSEILVIQNAILKEPNWHLKILDPELLSEYKKDLYGIEETTFLEAIHGLLDLLEDVTYLKEKYENPVKHSNEALSSSFVQEVKDIIKKEPILIKNALILPAPIQINRLEEDDVDWLLEKSTTQPDFWDPDSNFLDDSTMKCDNCESNIKGSTCYTCLLQSNKIRNFRYINIYCVKCAEEKNSTLRLTKIQYSKYIASLFRDRSLQRYAKKLFTSYLHDIIALCSDNCIPKLLDDAFVKEMNYLSQNSENDFHPGSEGKVMNLIHPSMFPYMIDPAAHLKEEKEQEAKETNVSFERNFFQEEGFGTSNYQSLPVDVKVDEEGQCTFLSYINNLYPEVYPNLYPILEMMLSCFIPLFEKCLKEKLANRQLQVIVKATDYLLEPGQTYEGQWHKEGTTQEHIVATGIYYYELDEELVDSGLEFRSEKDDFYDSCELTWLGHGDWIWKWSSHILSSFLVKKYDMDNCTNAKEEGYRINLPESLMDALAPNLMDVSYITSIEPLGHVETRKGRCVVFKNNHQHKSIGIQAPSSSPHGLLERRILCFFLVDPNNPIPSTLTVPPQQKEFYAKQSTKVLEQIKINETRLPFEIIHNIIHHAASGMSLKEALEHRVRFIHDRRMITDEIDTNMSYSLCED